MVNYVRYTNNFIVGGLSKELLEQDAMPIIKGFCGIPPSLEKTKIAHLDEDFDFLRQNVRMYNGNPSNASVATLLEEVRSAVKGNKVLDQPRLIQMLNPMIQGCVNYHQHVASKAMFACRSLESARVVAVDRPAASAYRNRTPLYYKGSQGAVCLSCARMAAKSSQTRLCAIRAQLRP